MGTESRLSVIQQPDESFEFQPTVERAIEPAPARMLGSILISYSFDDAPRFHFTQQFTDELKAGLPPNAVETLLATYHTFIEPWRAESCHAPAARFARQAAGLAVHSLSQSNKLYVGSLDVTETHGVYGIGLTGSETVWQSVENLADTVIQNYHEGYWSGGGIMPQTETLRLAQMLGVNKDKTVQNDIRATLVSRILAYGLLDEANLRQQLQR